MQDLWGAFINSENVGEFLGMGVDLSRYFSGRQMGIVYSHSQVRARKVLAYLKKKEDDFPTVEMMKHRGGFYQIIFSRDQRKWVRPNSTLSSQ